MKTVVSISISYIKKILGNIIVYPVYEIRVRLSAPDFIAAKCEIYDK